MSGDGYAVSLAWSGDTGAGYAAYQRSHTVSLPPAQGLLDLSADQAFRGDSTLPNPESLLLAAASSCQLLAFLALAARAGVRVRAYQDEATARLDLTHSPARMADIVLRPRVTVAAGSDPSQVEELVRQGHQECYVANSLSVPVAVEPTVMMAG